MRMAFDNVYDSRYDGFNSRDHFEGLSTNVAGDALTPCPMPFDTVYNDDFNGLRSKSHFPPSMSSPLGIHIAEDEPYKPLPRVLTTSRSKRLEPPPRERFLGRGVVSIHDLTSTVARVNPQIGAMLNRPEAHTAGFTPVDPAFRFALAS